MFRTVLIVMILFPIFSFQSQAVAQQKFLVELEESVSVDSMIEKYPSFQVTERYDTVFHGFAMTGSVQDKINLEKETGIKKIHPVSSYKVKLDESVPFLGGEHIRKAVGDLEEVTGKGVKVGVIDTGVDYHHPDLRTSYSGGYDVVDKDNDPLETTVKQGMPTSHGTHVAGIIAANGKLKGVAPEAEVYAYRALGPGGMGTSEQVIAAIERAVKDGMDIINLSLGNDVNGPDWPTSIALNKAVEKGVIAVTSTGNSGPGIWTVGSPGTSEKAISVGASAPPLKIPFIQLFSEDKLVPIRLLQGSPSWSQTRDTEIVTAGKGLPSDYKNAKGKVALVERGEISFTEKAINAENAGAKALLIYNNEKGAFQGLLEGTFKIPVASLTKEEGKHLLQDISSGHHYLETKRVSIEDQLASFSSRGPVTVDWGIKPDVTAPGVAINSTVPIGYEAMNGTSMAAPHVAGASALIKEKHPDWAPQEVKAALMNTAKKLYNEEGELYEVYEQGAGRIQIDRALKTESLAYPSSLSFGLFDKKFGRVKKKLPFTIENKGATERRYTFGIPGVTKGVQWKVPKTFTLQPYTKKQVEVVVDLQPEFLQAGMYSGYLEVRGGEDILTVPYLYIIEDTSYQKVMGFHFGLDDNQNSYKYELYLPEDVEQLKVMLFDPDTLRLVTTLHEEQQVKRGRKEGIYLREELEVPDGVYQAIVLIENEGKISTQQIYTQVGTGTKNHKFSLR
ncbi:S8 family serine peptidase [Bacillus tianshenii]|nr:S8 family serine peptidase [Bacillus tianshenii]